MLFTRWLLATTLRSIRSAGSVTAGCISRGFLLTLIDGRLHCIRFRRILALVAGRNTRCHNREYDSADNQHPCEKSSHLSIRSLDLSLSVYYLFPKPAGYPPVSRYPVQPSRGIFGFIVIGWSRRVQRLFGFLIFLEFFFFVFFIRSRGFKRRLDSLITAC
jgi:hypothetical protein